MEKEQNPKIEENINGKSVTSEQSKDDEKSKKEEVELTPEDKIKGLEEKIPGFLSKISISNPESSAKQINLVFLEKYLAFIIEFSLNDVPFSFGLLSFRFFGE